MSFDLCGSYLVADEGYFEGFLSLYGILHITQILPSHISTLWLSSSLNTNRMPKLCLGGNLEISRMLDKIIMELSFYKPRSGTRRGQNSLWQWNLFNIALMPWQKQSSAYCHTRKWKWMSQNPIQWNDYYEVFETHNFLSHTSCGAY